MALRSVLDIDVNDDKLRAVVDLMGKYQTAAARIPGAWASIGKQQATAKDVLTDIRNLMLVQIALLDRESKAFEGVRRQVDSTHRSMQGLSRSTREFVGHMRSATSVLLRWSGVGGLIAGLTGVLSAEGIGRLTGGGAAMFRSSQALAGTSPGQAAAAGSYGGILNAQQVLGQLTQMLTTAEGKRGLLGAGIGQNMWGMGAGAILPHFLTNLQRLSKSPMMGPNGEIMGDVLNAQGLGQFTELAQILRNMKPEQLAQLTNEYTKNQRELNKVTQETLFQYVRLQGTLEVAEAKIKSAFIIALEPMAPQFARIADAVSTAILHFGESETVKKWMTELAEQLEHVDMDAFAKRLEELGTSFVTVGRAVTDLITGLANAISWIDKKIGKDDKETKYGMIAGAGVGAAAGSVFGPPGALVGGVGGALVGGVMGAQAQHDRDYGRVVAEAAIPRAGGVAGNGANYTSAGQGNSEQRIRAVIAKAGAEAGLNPDQIKMAQAGFLSNFAYESGLRPDVIRKGGNDTGWAQWIGPRLRNMRKYGKWTLGSDGKMHPDMEANEKQLYDELTGPYKNFLIRAGKAPNPRASAEVVHYFESGGAPQFEGAVKQGHMAQAENFYRKTQAAEASVAAARGKPAGWTGDVRRGAPGVKFNSQGAAYSESLETQSAQEKRNVEASMAAIRAGMKQGKKWGELPAGVATQDPGDMGISVRKPPNVRVKIENETGGNPVSSAAQVAQ